MVVQQLVRAGFIVEPETTRSGRRPERTVYSLTDDGRREGRLAPAAPGGAQAGVPAVRGRPLAHRRAACPRGRKPAAAEIAQTRGSAGDRTRRARGDRARPGARARRPPARDAVPRQRRSRRTAGARSSAGCARRAWRCAPPTARRCSCGASIDAVGLAPAVDREELAGLEMLYRDAVELAVGPRRRASRPRTRRTRPTAACGSRPTAMPAAGGPAHGGAGPGGLRGRPGDRASRSRARSTALDMQTLAEAAPTPSCRRCCAPLVDAYEAWIDRAGAAARRPGTRASSGHEEAARRHLKDARAAAAADPRRASRRSRSPTSPRRSRSPTTRCGSSACTRSPPSCAGATTALTLRDAVARGRRAREPLVAAVPARVRAAQPAGARRPDAPRAHERDDGARRPAVLPDRRRQDRGVPRA